MKFSGGTTPKPSIFIQGNVCYRAIAFINYQHSKESTLDNCKVASRFSFFAIALTLMLFGIKFGSVDDVLASFSLMQIISPILNHAHLLNQSASVNISFLGSNHNDF